MSHHNWDAGKGRAGEAVVAVETCFNTYYQLGLGCEITLSTNQETNYISPSSFKIQIEIFNVEYAVYIQTPKSCYVKKIKCHIELNA